MRLSSIRVSNVFGFSDFELSLGTADPPVWAFIGRNNGGKTSLLRCIGLVLNAMRQLSGTTASPMEPDSSRPTANVHLPTLMSAVGCKDHIGVLNASRSTEAGHIAARLTTCVGTTDIVLQLSDKSCNVRIIVNRQPASPEALTALFSEFRQFEFAMLSNLGELAGAEKQLGKPSLEQAIAKGDQASVVRNRIFWLNNDATPAHFARVGSQVTRCIDGIALKPPSLTTHEGPQVEIRYEEDGQQLELHCSGSGMRTLLAIFTIVEMSGCGIIMIDEPDAHLHPQLQRALASMLASSALESQIFVTSHAPDFIDSLPTESLLWIDRANKEASPIDETGKILVDLGAISQATAMASLGSNLVMFVENKPDKQAFKEILRKCGLEGLADRFVIARLRGSGDAKYVEGVARVLRRSLQLSVAVACLTDSDYDFGDPPKCEDSLWIRLPVKELENLFLSEQTIRKALEIARHAAQRSTVSGTMPEDSEITSVIDEATRLEQAIDPLRRAWKQLGRDESELQELVNDPQQRRRRCSGKVALRHIRRWAQTEYSVSLTQSVLLEAFEPDESILEMACKLKSHVGQR